MWKGTLNHPVCLPAPPPFHSPHTLQYLCKIRFARIFQRFPCRFRGWIEWQGVLLAAVLFQELFHPVLAVLCGFWDTRLVYTFSINAPAAETTQQRECFCVSAVLDRYIDFLHAAALKVTFNIHLPRPPIIVHHHTSIRFAFLSATN